MYPYWASAVKSVMMEWKSIPLNTIMYFVELPRNNYLSLKIYSFKVNIAVMHSTNLVVGCMGQQHVQRTFDSMS